ncbi:MAG: hypothetical protein K2J86_02305 [Prevotella sp.]|nr:hypothetical protein [Prevotella sp.]
MGEKMMKPYIKPETNIHRLDCDQMLLAASGIGAWGDDFVQDEFLDTDVSYSRTMPLWGDD